jgi:hypothetical protein
MAKLTAAEVLALNEAKHPLPFGAPVDHIKQSLRPPEQQDEITEYLLGPDCGFVGAKRLEDGSYAVVQRLFATAAIGLGVEQNGMFSTRYCFEDLHACLSAWDELKSCKDEPEGWIARRPERAEDKEAEYQRTLAKFREQEALKANGSSFEP